MRMTVGQLRRVIRETIEEMGVDHSMNEGFWDKVKGMFGGGKGGDSSKRHVKTVVEYLLGVFGPNWDAMKRGMSAKGLQSGDGSLLYLAKHASGQGSNPTIKRKVKLADPDAFTEFYVDVIADLLMDQQGDPKVAQWLSDVQAGSPNPGDPASKWFDAWVKKNSTAIDLAAKARPEGQELKDFQKFLEKELPRSPTVSGR